MEGKVSIQKFGLAPQELAGLLNIQRTKEVIERNQSLAKDSSYVTERRGIFAAPNPEGC